MASSDSHKEKYLYECEYCSDIQNPFLTNDAKDFQNHLMNSHSTVFPNIINVTAYTSKYLRNSDDHLEALEWLVLKTIFILIYYIHFKITQCLFLA